MKTYRLGLAVLLVSIFLFVVNVGERANFSVGARSADVPISHANIKASLPSFLEKGKTYIFTFAVSLGDYNSHVTNPITMVGKIEKLDTDSGWVYINHYVTIYQKGKLIDSRFEGYSWINTNHVFQITEKTINP